MTCPHYWGEDTEYLAAKDDFIGSLIVTADLGLINAIQRYYGKPQPLTQDQIQELSQKWKPYRTVATWYLWGSLDPLPVQY